MKDWISLSFQALFPSVVLPLIQNTLATRHIVTLAPDSTDLLWTFFGYEDDDEETLRHRLRNINLVGPAGLISMEDGEAVELCQQGIRGAKPGEKSFIEMGGVDVQPVCKPVGMDENTVRGFWQGYFSLMKPHLAAMAAR
jgi:anthranilate 1,2-dioxygenase large subunit